MDKLKEIYEEIADITKERIKKEKPFNVISDDTYKMVSLAQSLCHQINGNEPSLFGDVQPVITAK